MKRRSFLRLLGLGGAAAAAAKVLPKGEAPAPEAPAAPAAEPGPFYEWAGKNYWEAYPINWNSSSANDHVYVTYWTGDNTSSSSTVTLKQLRDEVRGQLRYA